MALRHRACLEGDDARTDRRANIGATSHRDIFSWQHFSSLVVVTHIVYMQTTCRTLPPVYLIDIPKLLNQMRFWIHLGLDLQFREKLNVEPVPCQMNVWKAGVQVENPAKLVRSIV